ncbi:MAG: GGDEF domain-containing phosphodiesterase [Pseudomonadota bacterium]
MKTKIPEPFNNASPFNWLQPKGWAIWVVATGLLIMLISSGGVVYLTGGTSHAFVHIFYIPIILAGFFFSIWGGILAALIAGLLTGPWMPLDVSLSTQQLTFDWVIRCLFFVLMGSLSGMGSHLFRRYLHIIEQQSLTNPMTGLPNLRGLQRDFMTLTQQGNKVAVIVMEIRNLQDLEQALGATYTEEILQALAKDLQTILPFAACLGHSQTSGFIVLLPGAENLNVLLETLRGQSAKTYTAAGAPVYLEFAYGVALWPKDDQELNQLVRKAKVAVQTLQGFAQDVAHYAQAGKITREYNVRLLYDLDQAIKKQELILHYQPKVAFASGQIVGVEALVRWPHSQKGLINPGEFLPLAEETFLINPLTHWLFRQAVQDLHTLHKANFNLRVAVNVSVKNFYTPKLFEELIQLFEDESMSPKDFEIEITESAISPDIQAVIDVARRLRATGMKVSIDDFGTGQASQSYLYELPLDGLKIDQSFIRSLGQNSTGDAIVKSTILLGQELNLEVTAEGVETKAQYELLKKMGCALGQGYVIARPAPIEELMRWLSRR